MSETMKPIYCAACGSECDVDQTDGRVYSITTRDELYALKSKAHAWDIIIENDCSDESKCDSYGHNPPCWAGRESVVESKLAMLAAERDALKKDLYNTQMYNDMTCTRHVEHDAIDALKDKLAQAETEFTLERMDANTTIAELKEKIARLVMAGDDLLSHIDCSEIDIEPHQTITDAWTAAKEYAACA